MPIYEYRCKKGHSFEVRQSFTDGPVTACAVCGAPVERVYHPVAVHFKGSGFYNTDYGTRKRSREMKEAKESSSSESSSKSDSPSSSDSSKSSSGSDSSSSTGSDSGASKGSDSKSSTSSTKSDSSSAKSK
jgi:putative FmdB family regulatory protein